MLFTTPLGLFDKLKNTDERNTCDILRKYCCIEINHVSVASASVGFEQLSDQHVQKMAPQQKKSASPKKIAAKKTSPKKTAPKKAALKKKIASKRSAKIEERMAKKDSFKGKKKTTSKSAEERAARAARRSLAKEAPSASQPRVRFLKLGNLATQRQRDGSSDLVNLLTTSAGVSDISAASGSRQLRKEAVLEVSMRGTSEVTCCFRKC